MKFSFKIFKKKIKYLTSNIIYFGQLCFKILKEEETKIFVYIFIIMNIISPLKSILA